MTAGAVLCGGESRRMGVDKALLPIDGVPMAERVARALAAAGCDPVRLIGGDADRLGGLGRPLVADMWPGEGPLGGVLTALAGGDDVVTAACDLPALDAATIRAILTSREPGVDAVVGAVDGAHALVAWWAATARPTLADAWSAGVRSIGAALAAPALTVVRVEVDAAAVRNVNRPPDLTS